VNLSKLQYVSTPQVGLGTVISNSRQVIKDAEKVDLNLHIERIERQERRNTRVNRSIGSSKDYAFSKDDSKIDSLVKEDASKEGTVGTGVSKSVYSSIAKS